MDNTNTQLSNYLKERNHSKWLVKYWAEWCGHCKAMSSDWKKFISKYGEELKSKGINIVDIESKQINSLNYRPDFMGFPTLRIYNNGNAEEDMGGERTVKNMYQYALNHSIKQNGGGSFGKRKTFKRRTRSKKIAGTKKNKKRKNMKRKKSKTKYYRIL